MALPRSQVVAALSASADLTYATVIPYARDIDPPSKPTVMVRLDEVRPSGAATTWNCRFGLVLVTPQTTAGPADEELEGFLIDVLFALVQAEGLSWTNATRAIYNESNPAFEVACDYTAQISKE